MEALLITRNDLVKFTAINGNLDPDKFMFCIKIAQDIHIQNYLGTQLFNKLKTLIVNGDVDDVGNADYKTLLVDYVKPCLIHYAMVELLPNTAYTISNKGVYRHNSENSDTATKEEIDSLISKERILAQQYTERLLDFLGNNSIDFPEYNSNGAGDVFPDSNNNNIGWFI